VRAFEVVLELEIEDGIVVEAEVDTAVAAVGRDCVDTAVVVVGQDWFVEYAGATAGAGVPAASDEAPSWSEYEVSRDFHEPEAARAQDCVARTLLHGAPSCSSPEEQAGYHNPLDNHTRRL
jgi:hypothetical protein